MYTHVQCCPSGVWCACNEKLRQLQWKLECIRAFTKCAHPRRSLHPSNDSIDVTQFPQILGLSIQENLRPTVDFLVNEVRISQSEAITFRLRVIKGVCDSAFPCQSQAFHH
jgi:hypothetical protein